MLMDLKFAFKCACGWASHPWIWGHFDDQIKLYRSSKSNPENRNYTPRYVHCFIIVSEVNPFQIIILLTYMIPVLDDNKTSNCNIVMINDLNVTDTCYCSGLNPAVVTFFPVVSIVIETFYLTIIVTRSIVQTDGQLSQRKWRFTLWGVFNLIPSSFNKRNDLR